MLCNRHLYLVQNIFIAPKRTLRPISTHSPAPVPQALITISLPSCIYLVWIFHVNVAMIDMTLIPECLTSFTQQNISGASML